MTKSLKSVSLNNENGTTTVLKGLEAFVTKEWVLFEIIINLFSFVLGKLAGREDEEKLYLLSFIHSLKRDMHL